MKLQCVGGLSGIRRAALNERTGGLIHMFKNSEAFSGFSVNDVDKARECSDLLNG